MYLAGFSLKNVAISSSIISFNIAKLIGGGIAYNSEKPFILKSNIIDNESSNDI